MSDQTNSPDTFLLFVIGRPGSGKSTFARYLTRELVSTRVLYLNDYDLLLAQTKALSDKQIRWEKNGQFEILDRSIFDGLLGQLMKPIELYRGKRPIIAEFSRSFYVQAFEKLPSLRSSSFTIVYIESPVETCVKRAEIRAAYYPIKTTPASVIRNYHSEDDLLALQAAYPGRVRIVKNTASSLQSLEREASLLLEDILGTEHVKSLRSATNWAKELTIVLLLFLHLLIFLFISVFAWRAGPSSFLSSLLSDPNQMQFLKTVLYVAAAGGLGSTTYCVRALYHYYIRGVFDFDRFKWWYLFRPVIGSLLAVSSFAIVQGGVVALGAINSPQSSRSNMAWFGVAYLAGFGTEQVIEWLRRASKTVFGESRVQPDESDHN